MTAQQKAAKQYIDDMQEKAKFVMGGAGYLQTFAGDDDPGDDDPGDDDPGDGDDDPGDDDPGDDDDDPGDGYEKGSVDELMTTHDVDFSTLLKTNPKLKKQYQERFKRNMSERMKKYSGVDVDEYNDLKKRAESGNLEGDAKDWKEKYESLKVESDSIRKQSAIQEAAIDSSLDAEQTAFVKQMINLDKIETDDEGEWMGIDEEIERIQEKFPRMFDAKSDDKDSDDDKDKKKGGYNPGKKKHNGDGKGEDAKSKGKQRALARHKKQ